MRASGFLSAAVVMIVLFPSLKSVPSPKPSGHPILTITSTFLSASSPPAPKNAFHSVKPRHYAMRRNAMALATALLPAAHLCPHRYHPRRGVPPRLRRRRPLRLAASPLPEEPLLPLPRLQDRSRNHGVGAAAELRKELPRRHAGAVREADDLPGFRSRDGHGVAKLWRTSPGSRTLGAPEYCHANFTDIQATLGHGIAALPVLAENFANCHKQANTSIISFALQTTDQMVDGGEGDEIGGGVEMDDEILRGL